MCIGELLEKSTRMLTAEEKAQLEVPFVGKNGEKRKVEVSADPRPHSKVSRNVYS